MKKSFLNWKRHKWNKRFDVSESFWHSWHCSIRGIYIYYGFALRCGEESIRSTTFYPLYPIHLLFFFSHLPSYSIWVYRVRSWKIKPVRRQVFARNCWLRRRKRESSSYCVIAMAWQGCCAGMYQRIEVRNEQYKQRKKLKVYREYAKAEVSELWSEKER